VAIAVGAGIAGALVTVGVLVAVGAFRTTSGTPAVASTAATVVDDGARLAALAGPSVVGIVAVTPAGDRRASGVCTGDGHVLTTDAALAGATAVSVLDAQGGTHPAEVLGSDRSTGLVLLRTAPAKIRPAALAGDRPVRVGEWVVAVGRADASTPWAATGVVASLGGWGEDGAGTKRAGLISTSMAIPPAAIGGALVDRSGHVVGILAGAPTGGTLATPIGMARTVATELARSGTARHGALGLRATDAAPTRGATVTEVLAGTAAERAGVRPGDVVVRIEGSRVDGTADLVYEVGRRAPGDVVELRVRRGDERVSLRVTLDAAGAAGTGPSGAAPATPVAAGG
jgi:S1-C subfamily serine protease